MGNYAITCTAKCESFHRFAMQVYIKLTDNHTGNKYMWDSSKFSNRHGVMMELYNQVESGEDVLADLDQVRSQGGCV